jgi:8-oxo-dGTP pyrophosphatase MutT (NUDIX family)
MADYHNTEGKPFWGDIGAGILPFCSTTKRFLMQLRSRAVNEPGTYGIWGGKLDRGETDPKQAAIREFEEESKFNGNIKIEPLCVYKTEGFEYHNFLGTVSREFTPDISDCWESDGWKWVTLEEMEKLDLHFGVEYILDECSLELDDLIRESKNNKTKKGKKVNKNYLTAKTKADKERMKDEIDKHSDKKDDDKSAYGKWPADYKKGNTSGKKHKTKKSKHTKEYEKRFGKKESYVLKFDEFVLEKKENFEKALKNKEGETGIPYRILKKVYNKGLAAWKTGHRPGADQHQWAMGRVNSFIVGGPARKVDNEIWDEWKEYKKSNKEKIKDVKKKHKEKSKKK